MLDRHSFSGCGLSPRAGAMHINLATWRKLNAMQCAYDTPPHCAVRLSGRTKESLKDWSLVAQC